MATESGSQKPARVYIRDRMARIKEAGRGTEVVEANMGEKKENDYDEGRRTPPFLRLDVPVIQGGPRRLTINELTMCTKDSSQLATVMTGDRFGDDRIPSNRLEQSRKNKIMERDEANRKVAEGLEKASDKWQNQIKVLDRNVSNLESTGVKNSLFNDNLDSVEKSEKENSEKFHKTGRYDSNFSGRLDILLQRGLRNTWLSRSTANLRSLDERSHHRWNSKLDRFSSVWDLKYSLLHNRRNSNIHKNHYTPSCTPDITSNQNLRNFSNTQTPYSNYNIPQVLSNQSNNLSPLTFNNSLNSMYHSNVPQNYSNQLIHPYNNFHPAFKFPIDYTQSQSNPYCFQGHIPFQNTQQIIPLQNNQPNFQQYNNQMPFVSNLQNHNPSSNSMCNSFNNEPFINKESSNNDISNSIDCFSQKIADLTENLKTLNNSIDELKVSREQTAVKPIIKKFQSVERNYKNVDNSSETVTQKGGNRNNVFTLRTVSSSDRRVKFQSPEKYGKDLNMIPIEDSNISGGDCPCETQSFKIKDSVHPNSVNKNIDSNYQRNKDFKTFSLPAEATSVMMSQSKRIIRGYFREGK